MFRNLNFQRITSSVLITAMFNMMAVPMVQAQNNPTPLATELSAMGIGIKLGSTNIDRVEPRLSTDEEYAARIFAELHDHLKVVVPDAALPREALRLRTNATKVVASRDQRLKEIRRRAGDLRSYLGTVEKGFADDAVKFSVSKLSGEMIQRQRSALTQYRERRTEFERLVSKLDVAGVGSAGEQAALSELGTFMGKHAAGRGHRYTDPNQLPFRASDTKPREPFTTTDQFQASLFPERFQPVQLASLGMEGIGLREAALPLLPVAADTAPTEDVRLTQAVRDLAAELGNNPVRIYNWVRNQIAFVPTYGSIQGSELTLLNKRGNAFDTASLLIALYRASGIPARYAYGTIDVPIEHAMNWVGATTPEMAHTAISQGGVPNLALVSGGTIKVLRMEHVWVEAYVDFAPSRGAVNRAPDTWVPLDASFKQFDTAERPNVAEILGFEVEAYRQTFLNSATIDTDGARITGGDQGALASEIENLKHRGVAWANSVGTTKALGMLVGQRSVRSLSPKVLAGTLPYRVVLKAQTFQSVPANLRWTLTVSYFASDTDMAYENAMFEKNISLVEIGSRKLSLTFAPATDADAALLRKAQEDSASSLPAYLISANPRLLLDSDVLNTGYAAQFGTQQVVALTVNGPQHSSFPDRYDVTVGDELVISVDAAGITQAMIDERFAKVASDTASENLHTAGMVFWLLADMGDAFAGAAHGVTQMRLPSVAMLGAPLQSAYFFGIPRSATYSGRFIDAKRVVTAAAGKDGGIPAAYMRQSGMQTSNFEGLAFDITFQRETGSGGSAVRLINQAIHAGAPVYKISADNQELLNDLPFSADVQADLRNAVAAGKEVIVPGALSGNGNWQGIGYIVLDPETGSGAYLIDGGFNGGTDGAGCDGAPVTSPTAQPVQKPTVSLFEAIAYAILAIAVAALIVYAGVGLALSGVVIAASTAATAAGGTGDPLPPDLQKIWDEGFGRVYKSFQKGPNYPGDGITKPDCENHAQLMSEQKELCTNRGKMKCAGDCDPAEINRKVAIRNECVAKRLEVMFQCFRGGDAAHWVLLIDHLKGFRDCKDCMTKATGAQCKK